MTTPAFRQLQRRLARAELEHLRQLAVDLAARLEASEAALQRAEEEAAMAERLADFWQSHAADLAEHLPPDAHLGITQDGALGIVHATH